MDTQILPGSTVTDAELSSLEVAIRSAEPAFLGDLERLVNIDCGSYTPDGVDEVGRFVAAFMTDAGAQVEVRPDAAGTRGSTVIGTWDGQRGTPGAPRILL